MSMVAARGRRAVEDEIEVHRRMLRGYCYRMLGSAHEADDAVQETMIRAWRGLDALDSRAGLRAWLYRIATNVCLDLLSGRARRALPIDLGPADDGRGELGTPQPASTWVQPFPGAFDDADDPAERAVNRESVRLAFVTALQQLLPRQRAVLILRDVLRWRAAEVATLLDTSVDAVNSTLRRARATLAHAQTAGGADHPVDPERVDRLVNAFERLDMAELIALLHRDVVVSMPPFAFWLAGRDAFTRWLGGPARCTHARVVITTANGGPALGMYQRGPDGGLEAAGIHVPEWRDGLVVTLHAFLDPGLFPLFDLPTGSDRPRRLPGGGRVEETCNPSTPASSRSTGGPAGSCPVPWPICPSCC